MENDYKLTLNFIFACVGQKNQACHTILKEGFNVLLNHDKESDYEFNHALCLAKKCSKTAGTNAISKAIVFEAYFEFLECNITNANALLQCCDQKLQEELQEKKNYDDVLNFFSKKINI